MPQPPSGGNLGQRNDYNSSKLQYRHVPFVKPGAIRLLRLLPHPTQDAPLQCQLFEYPLLGPGEIENKHGSHLYEALSYVWGKLDGRHSISIDGRDLPVTANLHAALRHLRNRHLERILWVDAVCINQGNDGEKADQIQLMASIYSQANRVVVWLDEAGDKAGDWALQEIRRLAAEEMGGNTTELVISEKAKLGVLALLRRRWFERIWVLQEVAAAQSIQIRCGSIGLDGYAFSTALGSAALDPVYEAAPGLQSLIRPVTYLIRGATFRQGEEPVRISTRPLGELIDMYHSRQATVRHDKVFALLAMSSDPLPADLLPNYRIQWPVLFERVVTFLLGTQVTVETSPDTETAAISGRGVVIGKVSSTTQNRNNQQRVDVTLKDMSGRLHTQTPQEWTLPPLARPAQIDDLVCLLAGAARPTLIRQCNDYFSVIAIATPPLGRERAAVTSFPLRMLLVWDWEAAQPGAQRRDDYDTVMGYQVCPGTKMLALQSSKLARARHWSKLVRLWNAASVLDDGGQYREAAAALQQIIDAWEIEFGGENLGTLAAKERLVQVYRRSHEWRAAREILQQLIETRKPVQGARHPDTLRNTEELASTYEDEGALVPEKLEAITDILRRGTPLGRERVVWIAGFLDAEVLRMLFNHRGDEVEVTEDVTKAVAGNIWEGGASMNLLLDYRGDEVKITEDVLVAAASNKRQGSAVLAILLQRRKAEVGVTERVLAAATRNHWQGVQIKKLLADMEHCKPSQLGDDSVGAPLEPFELRNLNRVYDRSRIGLFTLTPIAPNWEAIHGKPTLQ
ncbi:hypothetical protein MAPG_05467 [Magnaporthiopsis poae ATCC 64411]|uniref:Heterokaryon incompatibility domain-containing protein n=1 Tax=Magnaporthiopsis poae (strain ATCC 64411 / 73-15) TaxID=644358 RepID=A0A0C4DZG6_MAGP6|nr:hypothetical protein MAPG_05467 [Magnaporthiopsis poae ATCC 64411]